MDLNGVIQIKYVISAVIYSFIGAIVFAVCFTLLDLLTPKVSIWKELVEKQNVAVAIFLGAIGYGLATIIASAIHG